MKIQPSKLEALSESWFRRGRKEMAACLAAGDVLLTHGNPLLTFEDLENHLYPKYESEVRKAMLLCATFPEIGGKHMQRILEGAALELVDNFQDAFRASYEEEINRSDAA